MLDVAEAAARKIRPAWLAALRLALSQLRSPPASWWWKQWNDTITAGHDVWCRTPELAELGFELLEPRWADELRVWACQWLTHFPTEETVRRLAEVLADTTSSVAVRSQAAWTLSYRQLQTRDDALVISPAVERAADDALLAAWGRGDWRALPMLVSGARHVRDERLFARLEADVPVEVAAEALEAFASPSLARKLLGALPEVRDRERVRIIRLVGATLGAEVVAPLLAFAEDASIGDRVEALFTALAIDPERAREPVRKFLASLTIGATFEARAKWHEANPGVLPVVHALGTMRRTATIATAERASACLAAATDLAALGRIAPYAEQYVVDLWRFAALRSQAPQCIIQCVETLTSPFEGARFLVPPYLDALAAVGRFRHLAQVASKHDAEDHAAWTLARHRRPLLALAAARHVRTPNILSCAGEALAWSELERGDLARTALAERLTSGAPLWGEWGAPPFPGPDEVWRANVGLEPILRAVVTGDVDALRRMRERETPSADPDATDRKPIATLEASLVRDLSGASVALVGKLRNETEIRTWLKESGAVVASGAFANVRFYVACTNADPETLAMLANRGAVRIAAPRPSSFQTEPPMIVRTYRVTLLPPTVHTKDKKAKDPLAAFLAHTFEDCFLRDRRIALQLASEELAFETAQRHDLLRLDVDLGRSVVRLSAEHEGGTDEWVAIGAQPLGALIAQCIRQWLDARGLEGSPASTLPAFTLDQATACARWIDANAPEAPLPEGLSPELGALTSRALDVATVDHHDLHARLAKLQETPEDPATITALRSLAAEAPRWKAVSLAIARNAKVDREERLDAYSNALESDPADDSVLNTYSDLLAKEGRYEEAWRYADRASRLVPGDAGHHYTAVEHGVGIGRLGAKLADARRRLDLVERLVEEDLSHPGSPDLTHLHLRYDASLMFVGRVDEAIALRKALIGGNAAWPQQNKLVTLWQSRRFFARSYAREGAHRGDVGRVLEGFAAERPRDGNDFAAYIDAWLALGRDEHAALAFAHFHLQDFGKSPLVRVAGARALAATGRLPEALEQIECLVHGQPQRRLDTEIDRILRVLATAPADVWEAQIRLRTERGATTLARRVVRDASDFVPGFAVRPIVRELLGPLPPSFDPKVLTPFGKLVPAKVRTAIDKLFTSARTEDALSSSWPEKLPDDAAGRAYLFAQALARYFARSGAELASGLRHVAAGALESLWHVEVSLDLARAILATLENASAHVDDARLDGWLLRLERALLLDERGLVGATSTFDGGPELARISGLLRGDDTVAAELREAHAAAKRDDNETAFVLLDRCVRALGTYAVADWVNAAERCRAPAVVRDVAWVAAVANAFHGVPAFALARGYFADGRGDLAREVIARFAGGAGTKWREKRLEELTPTWEAAKLDVPIGFDAAQTRGFEAIQSGQWELAERCYLHCLAIDPDNAQCRKNLGIVSARIRGAFATMLAFAAADVADGPLWTGSELMAAKKPAEAQAALEYASATFSGAPQWLQLALACWHTGDEETKANAIGKALELDPSAVAPVYLNGYASAKQELGELDECEAAAKRLLELAPNDPTMKSCALHNLACVALARGKKNALALAKEALALNPLPDNKAPFEDTVARCKRKDPHPITPSRAKSPEGVAFARLAEGDPKAVTIAVEKASPRLLRAAVAVARYRFASENDVVVTARARKVAAATLARTEGTTDRDEALARVAALRIVEDALYSVDPPALLGAQVPRDTFRDQLEERPPEE